MTEQLADDVERKATEKEKKEAAARQREQEQNEWNVAAARLQGYIGRLITYSENKEGERAGYLVSIHRTDSGIANSVVVQPIGSFGKKPDEIVLAPTDCKPYDGYSKYPTLETYGAANGWNKKKVPVLLVAGDTHVNLPKDAAQRINIAIQTAAAEADKKQILAGPGDAIAAGIPLHDVVILDMSTKEVIAEMHASVQVSPVAQNSTTKEWNPERACELFKGGMKVIDIAVEMGYERGQGQNRTKAALKKAGLLA